MSWVVYALIVVALILSAIYATLITLEDAFLLHPTPCAEYLAWDQQSAQFMRLPSGALLLHCAPRANTPSHVSPPAAAAPTALRAREEGRTVLCLHGNSGNLDGMANMARTLLDRGYDVYLLEPAGYGVCAHISTHLPAKHGRALDDSGVVEVRRRVLPTAASLVRDLKEAWNVLPKAKRSSAILLGFSMGGGVICQFLKSPEVLDEDLPSQVALLNTYYDLPLLVSDVLPIPLVPRLMRTQWNANNGIDRYCTATKSRPDPGNVLVVAALDDELIPVKHSHMLIQSIRDTYTRRELVVLPNGGHNNSVETHFSLWLPSLLPARPGQAPPQSEQQPPVIVACPPSAIPLQMQVQPLADSPLK